MTTPTRDKISKKALQLCQNCGCPASHDTEIWLEAERKLKEDPAPNTFAARSSAEAASQSEGVIPRTTPPLPRLYLAGASVEITFGSGTLIR